MSRTARLCAAALAALLGGCSPLPRGPDGGGPSPGSDGGSGCTEPFAHDGGVLAVGLSVPRRLGSDGTTLFVTEVGTPNHPTGRVLQLLDDGGVTALASGLTGPEALFADAQAVYWVDSAGLQRFDRLQRTSSTVDTAQNNAIYGDTELLPAGGGLVYATAWRALEYVPRDGGVGTPLYFGPLGTVVKGAAAEGGFAYFLVSGNGAPGLYRVPVDGSSAATQVRSEPDQGRSLVVTPDAFYWAAAGADGGEVRSAPRDGGSSSVLASGLVSPGRLVKSAGALYFQVSTAGQASTQAFFQHILTCDGSVGPVGPFGTGLGDLLPDASGLLYVSSGSAGQGFVGRVTP